MSFLSYCRQENSPLSPYIYTKPKRNWTLCDEDNDSTLQILLDNTDELRFHHLHGRNARIGNNGITASRPNALGEFNDAIVVSNRPLRDAIQRMIKTCSSLCLNNRLTNTWFT